MTLDLDFSYAQTRIQARFAALPPEAEWQRLAASRTLASFLEEARTGPLRDWVKGFSAQSDVHDLEVGLRSMYRETLEAVAGWVPDPWHEAVSWVRWLTLLPLLSHLQAGSAMPAWVPRDPALEALLDADGELNLQCLADAGAGCLVRPDDGLTAVWVDQWRRRWPPCRRELSRPLEDLTALLMGHLDAFAQVPPESAWGLRRALRERLRLCFHRHALQPTVPFLYLALMALDLERLRSALVSRVLFAAPDEQAGQGAAGRLAV